MSHDVNYRTKPLSAIYEGIKEHLLNDDLSFINLEYPIDEDRPQSSYPSFNVHPEYVEAAIIAGFDVFSMANNHTNDFGLKSVNKTVKNMDRFVNDYGIFYSGIDRKSTGNYQIEMIQIENFRIGYLAVTQFNNNYWSEKGAAKIYVKDYRNPEEVDDLISFIEQEEGDYDCFILSYHGGLEYKSDASNLRKNFFDRLIDAGVDILWGHHPHVLQPWVHETREDGDKLIMYSMGNFISGQLAIVDPVEHDINFAATGFSSLFKLKLVMDDGVIRIKDPGPEMIANVRNENNYFVTVEKHVALEQPMSDEWKAFYEKMFPVAEYRIRKE